MSGTANAVFRPDFTDYTTPQNRLAPQPTWADAATYTAQAVGDYIAQQRAKSEQMGLWDQSTGLPTGAGVVNAAQQYGSGMLMGTTAPGIRAFHGSPYDFERFDTSKIGTGEGAQAYGHGLYFAEGEGTARSYRDKLALQMPGKMYEVNIGADPEQFLHWDKPLSEQSPQVKDALAKVPWAEPYLKSGNLPGAQIAPKTAEGAQQLRDAGIPGIRYLDQGSRDVRVHGDYSSGTGVPTDWFVRGSKGDILSHHPTKAEAETAAEQQRSKNYVVFDANTIDILRKYGLAGLGIGLGGAVAGTQQQSQ